jgi:hypothetical protein
MLPPLYRIPPLGPPPSSAKDRVRALWSGVDVVPLEKEASKAKPACAIMPQVLSYLRIDKRQSEAEIARVWNNLMAPDVVAHAQPTGIRNGTVFITVDSNVWLSELVRYRRKEILDRLQHSFGREFVKRLSFRVAG